MSVKWYAVSSGNGNDGVSQLFPDYYVKTDEPWLVATLAAVSEFKAGYGRAWCRDNLMVDGEAEYTIYATIYDPPGDRDGSWSEANGAWRIWEVFPVDDDRKERPQFETVEECFGAAMVRAQRKIEARKWGKAA